jgi:hypothetical protein
MRRKALPGGPSQQQDLRPGGGQYL